VLNQQIWNYQEQKRQLDERRNNQNKV
jgi:hypothetical protein